MRSVCSSSRQIQAVVWLQVGGFCMMHKDDLKRVAPLWLQFSKAVRHDPDVRRPHPMPLHT